MRLPRPLPRDVLRWLVVGLAVREGLSFWTGHPYDFEVWVRNAYFVSAGWNPYTFMPPVPGLSFAYLGGTMHSVGYPPLWSLVLAGLYRAFAVVGGGNRFVLYFLLKQPAILGDVGLGLLIAFAARSWGSSREAAVALLRTWMLFPYAILVSAVWGQFDALVACLMLAAFLSTAAARRSSLLGLGVLLKLFPFVFVPYEFLARRGRSRWSVLLAVGIPVAFTAAVFVAAGWGTANLSGTLSYQGHGYPQGMNYGELLTSPDLQTILTPAWPVIEALALAWVPALFAASVWAWRRLAGRGPQGAVQAAVLVVAVVFLTRWELNEQYLIYLVPLLALDVALWHPERRSLLRWTWLLGLGFLLLNNFFLVRFLAPVFPGEVAWEDSLNGIGAFALAREAGMDAIAILFSLHLVNLVVIVVRPDRDATPWLVRGLRALAAVPARSLRGAGAGR